MSSVKGVNATLIAAGGVAKIAQGSVDADIRSFTDTYEASGLATSSTITMGPVLQSGSRVMGFRLAYDAISTVSVSLGDSASTARYLASVDTANAVGEKVACLIDGIDYVIGTAAGDNQILISTTGVSAATGTIKLTVYYTNN